MSKPSTAQWQQLKENLSGCYGQEFMNCDGYFIGISVMQDRRKLVIGISVDGFINFSDAQIINEDQKDDLPEKIKKFYYLRNVPWDKKITQMYEKMYGKRECKRRGVYKKRYLPWPFFNTPGAMITHLKKHCENIVIIDYEKYQSGLAEKQTLDTRA